MSTLSRRALMGATAAGLTAASAAAPAQSAEAACTRAFAAGVRARLYVARRALRLDFDTVEAVTGLSDDAIARSDAVIDFCIAHGLSLDWLVCGDFDATIAYAAQHLKGAPAADPVVAAALEWAALEKVARRHDPGRTGWADCPVAIELDRRRAAAYWRLSCMRPSSMEGVAMMARVLFFDQLVGSGARFDRVSTWDNDSTWDDGRDRRLMLAICEASEKLVA